MRVTKHTAVTIDLDGDDRNKLHCILSRFFNRTVGEGPPDLQLEAFAQNLRREL